jgi:hypothetical protein
VTCIYPSYQYLVEKREAEIEGRKSWIEELVAKWGLVVRS